MLVRLGEDRFRQLERNRELRAENMELDTLLRSALRELAQVRGEKNPRRFADNWVNERRDRSGL